MTVRRFIYHPQLPGDAFFWEAGPVGVLLCHGFTATVQEVRPLAEVLHAHGYTVAAPLMPGHYTTPEDLNQTSWLEWVQAGEEMYQRLKERCTTLVIGGESMGGLVALYLASEHPEIAAILAYAPALRLLLSKRDRLRLRLYSPFKAYIPKTMNDDGTPWQGYSVVPLKGTLELIRFGQKVLPRLKQIYQPILIVQGRYDARVQPGVPELIAQQVNSTVKEVVWMENSSHVVVLDKEWQQVAGVTLDFLKRVLPSGK